MLACIFDFFHACMLASLLACLLPSLLPYYIVCTCLQWDSPPDYIPTKAEALDYSSTEYSNHIIYWLSRLITWVDPLLLSVGRAILQSIAGVLALPPTVLAMPCQKGNRPPPLHTPSLQLLSLPLPLSYLLPQDTASE
jgi:hypothetical protein